MRRHRRIVAPDRISATPTLSVSVLEIKPGADAVLVIAG
jgi:hypothetical protein